MNCINQQRLIHLRLSRGLAVRQLARDSGIEVASLNRLETAESPSLATLPTAALVRLANRLGVSVGSLFTDEQPHEYDSDELSPADAQMLGSLLTALGQETPVVTLADSLDWTSTRVHQAASQLDHGLRPVGMTVFKSHGRIGIRPIDDRHSDAELAVRRHPRARIKQRLLSPARSRTIHRAMTKPISPHGLTTSDRLNIATMLKAGVLVEDESRHFVPSADVLLSLYPEGNHEFDTE